jgi:hypothetical protein
VEGSAAMGAKIVLGGNLSTGGDISIPHHTVDVNPACLPTTRNCSVRWHQSSG